MLEKITHKEEIEEILTEGENIYNHSVSCFEKQKKATTNALEKLGELKLDSWSKDINHFLTSFGRFKDIELIMDSKDDYTGNFELPMTSMISNMNNASNNAKEILKVGALSIGTGALVGVAAYGGAIMFAHASTGTAIATLTGAAKTSATLAWFGGGSLATGGLGIKGGIAVLGTAVAIPALLVAGAIAYFKGKERLAEAHKIHDQNVSNAKKIDIETRKINHIEVLTSDYIYFIIKFRNKFNSIVGELDKIVEKYKRDNLISFSSLSDVEKKTLHISWLMAQLYYQVLSTRILTEKGNLTKESKNILSDSENELEKISNEIIKLEEEKNQINKNIVLAKTLSNRKINEISHKMNRIKNLLRKCTKINKKVKLNLVDVVDTFEKMENLDLNETLTKLSEDEFNDIYNNIVNMNNDNKFEFLVDIDETVDDDFLDLLLLGEYKSDLKEIEELFDNEYSNISLDSSNKLVESVNMVIKSIDRLGNRLDQIHKSLLTKKKYIKVFDNKSKKFMRKVQRIVKHSEGTINIDTLSKNDSKKCSILLDSFVMTSLIEDTKVIDRDLSIIEFKPKVKMYKKILRKINFSSFILNFKAIFGLGRRKK